MRLVLELPTLETPHDNCIYLYVKEGVPCFSITGHKAQYFIQDYTPVIEKYSLKFVDLESQVSLCRN
ncbi:MAG: hypothetical protein VKJ02_06630 [Snowella sp.]|nr:hypothetical protein [Snowella sp.]